jgi:acyl-CoA thioesterase-1
MKEKGVAVNDLFAAMTPHLAEYQPPADVHFTGPGYDFLGAKVAAAIGAGLK